MKTAFTYVFLMAAILSFASGCALEEMSAPREGDVHMRFSLSVAGKAWTKSSIDVDEDKLSDINLYAYRDGRLEAEIYIGNMPHEAEMVLSGKYEYEIYALANTGRIRAPEDEQELVSMVYAAGDGNTFEEKGFPMAAKLSVVPSSFVQEIPVPLVRLVSKVNFRVDTGELGGLEVKSVRLRQSPLDVMPFSEASPAGAVSDGDIASSSDIQSVNSGGTVSFYMLENCQGVLLPGNEDQWQKIPDNIPDKADLCTYIEVEAEFDGSGGFTGPVLYRFYLGQDTVSDFNVFRNTESVVTLSLTEGALAKVSWRIDSSGVIADGIRYILNAPEYSGQWGTLKFPDATADNPVTVSFNGETLTIPSETAAHMGRDLIDDAPVMVVYLPDEPDVLNICLALRNNTFTVKEGIREQTIEVNLKPYPQWIMYADALSHDYLQPGSTVPVNEDGEELECWLYLYDQETGDIIYPRTFLMPEKVRQYVDRFRKCPDRNSHLYWFYCPDFYMAGDCADYKLRKVQPALEDSDEVYLYVLDLYGLEADGDKSATATFSFAQVYLSGETEYEVEVRPAFPDQKHLGMTYNYQLALGELQSSRSTLMVGADVSESAEWKIARGSRYKDGDELRPEGEVMDTGEDNLLYAKGVSDCIVLHYETPSRIEDMEKIAGGTYHIRGSVTNPHTGRHIQGDYSVDVVLYMIVGAEVNFYRGQDQGLPSGTYLDFSYMPLIDVPGVKTDNEYWGIHALCDIYNTSRKSLYSWGYPFLSGRKVDSIRLPDLNNLDSSFGVISSALRSYLSEAGREFRFVNPDDGSYHDVLLYYDPDGEYAPGTVFFELHRLQDEVPGTYLIEDYFGSFDNY